ncbi:PTS lactose/cellobiose transporter subunit IIA [Streptococcus gordonii]|uniref:PTS lactose/cellobiose transporter subunit IIA n=1 Tax=Streptococcus gordonii TaxID=1302 RepID=UPI001CBB04FD|nr:PTS lactose/cellobiose transporter subunit IIA [Streptococcus gordonii]MBZ2133873.1 PTS lactose/cellobiose transporter subunit IIA [Streptococcus gordonii]MBZ2142341.1 PTS lactose/cellobiose transporter subunit IIA [Streptococcus gordonii]MBZ2144155.1 PTS lactose/cellobiose transporter subunit IIA [Streptococcus gordonii]MBZ2146260.1 PTS lactose/cellobiose transporter subunit IIA [Streptococcus gordonii]
MTDQSSLEIAMQLIMYGGEAKSCAVEAISAAKQGDFEKAESKLSQAQAALLEAHHTQTDMLTKEAQGERNEINLFMIHGQDHLMTSIAFVDLAKEIIELHQKLEN